jgi:hypothetical protein
MPSVTEQVTPSGDQADVVIVAQEKRHSANTHDLINDERQFKNRFDAIYDLQSCLRLYVKQFAHHDSILHGLIKSALDRCQSGFASKYWSVNINENGKMFLVKWAHLGLKLETLQEACGYGRFPSMATSSDLSVEGL